MPQLLDKKVVTSGIFALCFHVGGGIMTIGGVDQTIHSRLEPDIRYAKLLTRTGWFTVRLLDVQFQTRAKEGGDSSRVSVGATEASLNTGNLIRHSKLTT